MLIVGLYFAHDASVCIVDNGRVVGLYQRERFTRVKRQAFLPANFLEFCLTRAGVDWRDVDRVAVSSTQSWPMVMLEPERLLLEHDPAALDHIAMKGLSAAESAAVAQSIRDRKAQAETRYTRFRGADDSVPHKEYVGNDRLPEDARTSAQPSMDWPTMSRWWRDEPTAESLADWCSRLPQLREHHLGYSPIVVTFDGVAKPGLLVPHHLAHAAAAYYPSDSDHAAVYTLDNGDGYDAVFGYKGGIYALGTGNRLVPIGPTYDYHGNLYQRVGERLDLGHAGAAGKLMGLAPYGRPLFYDNSLVGNGHSVLGQDFSLGTKTGLFQVLDPLMRVFKRRRTTFYRSAVAETEHYDPDAFGCQDVVRPGVDLAMSAQRAFEENALRSMRWLFDGLATSGQETRTLALSGGGALNCPANSRIWADGIFETVFVPPYCDDSGLALGAALAVAHDVLDLPRQPMAADRGEGAYLGFAYDRAAVDAAVEAHRDTVAEVPVGDPARAAAEDIAAGRIAAWFEGRSETGPRALGHRSILADPRDATKWREVNRVKKREYWRPFAPAVLAEKAGDWFSGAPTPSPFMLFNAQLRSRSLPAITHVDNSARIQTVDASCGGFRRVLEAFDDLTGVPVVMNTSFNGPGEPIVETPDEALRFLASSEIDAVYVEGRKFTRRG